MIPPPLGNQRIPALHSEEYRTPCKMGTKRSHRAKQTKLEEERVQDEDKKIIKK